MDTNTNNTNMDSVDETPAQTPSTQTVPVKQALYQMRKKDLQERCLELGLSDVGDRETLKRRIYEKLEPPSVQKKLEKFLLVKRNIHGNYEDVETHFIFNPKSKKAIGKQNADGTVKPLEPDDFQVCIQKGFSWQEIQWEARDLNQLTDRRLKELSLPKDAQDAQDSDLDDIEELDDDNNDNDNDE